MDGLQSVQIDLEAEAELPAIRVWHYHSQARAYHDVIVQVSNDPTFANGVTTLFNRACPNNWIFACIGSADHINAVRSFH
jgi:hypothetical protein